MRARRAHPRGVARSPVAFNTSLRTRIAAAGRAATPFVSDAAAAALLTRRRAQAVSAHAIAANAL